jgi:hypothetical protein
LIRLNFAYGVSCDTLAAVYKDNRMAIWRALQGLQERIAAEVRIRVKQSSNASVSEIESMVRMADDRLRSLLSEWLAKPLRSS